MKEEGKPFGSSIMMLLGGKKKLTGEIGLDMIVPASGGNLLENWSEIEDIAWELYQSGIKVKWTATPIKREEFRAYEDYKVFMTLATEQHSKIKAKEYDKTIIDVAKIESDTIAEIETIAWNTFLNRIGIVFKRPLTDEEKRKITDDKSFDYYRDIAVKIYEKKQRALTNKKYPIIDVPASGKRTWMGGAYTLCFVYSKYKGNFVLRGYREEVDEYLKKNYTHYFYFKSMWHRGESRGSWGFWKKDIGIFEPDKVKSFRRKGYESKFRVREYTDVFRSEESQKNDLVLKFKRLPKRWIPDFDKF